MNENTSANHVTQLLADAIRETAPFPGLARLHSELETILHRLQQPMRVAIVGLIKAGKSTVMNALLGEVVVATGAIETTFNINWLLYADSPSLLIHYKDGRPTEVRPYTDLAVVTKRDQEHKEMLTSIKYIEVFLPNQILRTLQLIDTPGLASVHEDDSENTRSFINVHGHELNEMTQSQTSQADAVLYLFSQSISASIASTIEEFQGPALGTATPINSIGVLTRVDDYWPDESDPLQAGERIARRLQSQYPQVQRLLYSIVPVTGLLALGAQTMTTQEFTTLTALAQLPEATLKRHLKYAKRFSQEVLADLPVPPEQRKQVLQRMGQYGIWRACHHIRSGAQNIQQLEPFLLEESGLPTLRKIILSHFGNRAFVIKLDGALRQIMTISLALRRRVEGQELALLKRVARTFEELATQQEELAELAILRSYYEGRLNLEEEEVQQLLQVTGEHGTAYWQRLGMETSDSCSTEELLDDALTLALEKHDYWRQRGIDPGLDSATNRATLVMARAYERITHYIRQAQQQLNLLA